MNSRKIFLYRGYHSQELFEILKSSWKHNDFVLLIPLQIKDFSFLQIIQAIGTEINFVGQWPADVKASAASILSLEHHERPQDQAVLEQAVVGVFTSGTTSGRTRLVFYSKENILSSLQSIRELFAVDHIKNIFVYPQPTHCFGLILGYFQSIIYNHKLNFSEGAYSKKAHREWLEKVDQNTITLGAPVHFSDLLQFCQDHSEKIKPSYSAIVGGAPVTQSLWLQMQNGLKIEKPSVGYGGTEASPGLTHLPPGMVPQTDGDIGYRLKGVSLKLNEKQIMFSGPNACLAIYDNFLVKTEFDLVLPDVLQESIEADGKQRLHFIGRSDLLVNRGGQKISLEKIENRIASYFECRCVAISFYDARLDQDIAVLVEAEHSPNTEAIQSFLESECALKIPSTHIVFTKIPLNANNKYDRKECLKILLKRRTWSFPIAVDYVKKFLPHDGSAIWVDRILRTEKNSGVTETTLKATGKYFVNGRLSESSLIEFMAQSYGYTLALNDILNIQNMKTVTTTLIAEVKNSQFNFENFEKLPQPGDTIQIETVQTHDFGALKVVEGKVLYNNKNLATLNMKLYCN